MTQGTLGDGVGGGLGTHFYVSHVDIF
jgi:hypothetical protein